MDTTVFIGTYPGRSLALVVVILALLCGIGRLIYLVKRRPEKHRSSLEGFLGGLGLGAGTVLVWRNELMPYDLFWLGFILVGLALLCIWAIGNQPLESEP